MRQTISAGILLYRQPQTAREPEIFLVQGTNHKLWGVPKGRMEAGETFFETAEREFREETGNQAPATTYHLLPPARMSSGKTLHIFTGDAGETPITWDKKKIAINTRTDQHGKFVYYRETRAGEWFPLSVALNQIGKGQKPVIVSFETYYTAYVMNMVSKM